MWRCASSFANRTLCLTSEGDATRSGTIAVRWERHRERRQLEADDIDVHIFRDIVFPLGVRYRAVGFVVILLKCYWRWYGKTILAVSCRIGVNRLKLLMIAEFKPFHSL